MVSVLSMLEKKSRKAVLSLSPGDTVQAALEIMQAHTVRSVVVLEGEKLVGIVSERDCALKVLQAGRDARQTRVSEIMTAGVVTVGASDSIDHCMHEMTSRNIRHLPVCSGQRVIGMVSIGDVVKELIRQQAEHIAYLETYIRGHGLR